MTDKISARTPELERRLECAKQIRKAVDYKGTADHEDVQSILRKFQEEITKEFTDRIVERLEKLRQEYPYKVVGEYDTYSTYNEAWSDCSDRAIAIVKGVQND